VDVAVIGAGFTGISAALHLAAAGADVAVLEARDIGWGASGRAFGQVVPYLKVSETALIRRFGPERGAGIIAAVAAGPNLVFGLIDKHRIACWPVRTGLLFAAHSPSGRRGLERRAEYWQRHDASVEMLNAEQTAAMIGSELYPAALLDRRGGHINPFAYVRGLASAAVKAGARIHTQTLATAVIRQDSAWCVKAGAHQLTSEIVIVATNAYTTALWPGLRESVIPVRGHGFVSAPLSDNVRQSLLPGRQSLTDTRRLYSAVRLLPDGRLHASAHGPPTGRERVVDVHAVNGRITRLFPKLGPVAWEQGWSGWVAMTPDHLPRLHELAPGLFAGLGYNGRGIAAATMIARDLAGLALGRGETVFPRSRMRPLSYWRFAPSLVRAAAMVYRARDLWDEMRLE
jgi:glycine/D-amino acid oxidase-like deaminating enzyme